MSLNDEIEIIEGQLRAIFSTLPIKEIHCGDINKCAHSFPAIHLVKTGISKNNIQVFSGREVGMSLQYDVSCLFSGSEGQQTIKNAVKFVNNVYDVLQQESLVGRHLENTCFDIDCSNIAYGLVEFDDVLLYGGVITLEIDIIYNIGE